MGYQGSLKPTNTNSIRIVGHYHGGITGSEITQVPTKHASPSFRGACFYTAVIMCLSWQQSASCEKLSSPLLNALLEAHPKTACMQHQHACMHMRIHPSVRPSAHPSIHPSIHRCVRASMRACMRARACACVLVRGCARTCVRARVRRDNTPKGAGEPTHQAKTTTIVETARDSGSDMQARNDVKTATDTIARDGTNGAKQAQKIILHRRAYSVVCNEAQRTDERTEASSRSLTPAERERESEREGERESERERERGKESSRPDGGSGRPWRRAEPPSICRLRDMRCHRCAGSWTLILL